MAAPINPNAYTGINTVPDFKNMPAPARLSKVGIAGLRRTPANEISREADALTRRAWLHEDASILKWRSKRRMGSLGEVFKAVGNRVRASARNGVAELKHGFGDSSIAGYPAAGGGLAGQQMLGQQYNTQSMTQQQQTTSTTQQYSGGQYSQMTPATVGPYAGQPGIFQPR